MEFWGVEVKSGEPLRVESGDGFILHLSQACLGEAKKDKGNESVCIYVNFDDQKLVLGTLSHDKIPQIPFDLVFEKDFELSHNLKNGSVYFSGYKVAQPDTSDSDEFNSDGEEDLPFPVENEAKQPKPEEENPAKPDSKQKVKIVEPSKDGKPKPENDDSSDEEDDSSDDGESSDDQMDGDISPVLAPKQKDVVPKEDNSPAKPTPSSSAKGTPSTSKSMKGKRKLNGEDAKSSNGAPVKKVKTENQEVKPTVKEESSPATKGTATPKVTTPSSKTGSTSGSTGPVSEEEIRAVLLQNGPVTTQDLVARFKSRLRTPEDKKAFADILRRISKIQKTSGSNYVVLRDK